MGIRLQQPLPGVGLLDSMKADRQRPLTECNCRSLFSRERRRLNEPGCSLCALRNDAG